MRTSRARQHVDWEAIFAEIRRSNGGFVELARPRHLTTVQTRDRLVALAARRRISIETLIVMGHLMVRSFRP